MKTAIWPPSFEICFVIFGSCLCTNRVNVMFGRFEECAIVEVTVMQNTLWPHVVYRVYKEMIVYDI